MQFEIYLSASHEHEVNCEVICHAGTGMSRDTVDVLLDEKSRCDFAISAPITLDWMFSNSPWIN